MIKKCDLHKRRCKSAKGTSTSTSEETDYFKRLCRRYYDASKKTEIIVIVLALLIETICKQLNDSSFISVLSDAFKKKSVKSMPIMEFHPIHGLRLKVLEFLSN